jgi:hypothetical protein
MRRERHTHTHTREKRERHTYTHAREERETHIDTRTNVRARTYVCVCLYMFVCVCARACKHMSRSLSKIFDALAGASALHESLKRASQFAAPADDAGMTQCTADMVQVDGAYPQVLRMWSVLSIECFLYIICSL